VDKLDIVVNCCETVTLIAKVITMQLTCFPIPQGSVTALRW